MAFCGCVFDTRIEFSTAAEARWWGDALEIVELDGGGGEAPRALVKSPCLDPDVCDGDFTEFDWEIEDHAVHFFVGESGDPELVAWLIQQFLAKFHPDQCHGFIYGVQSTRAGENSGGAYFITADKIERIGARLWLNRKISAFHKKSCKKTTTKKAAKKTNRSVKKTRSKGGKA